jgi:hypothetical protein
MARTLRESRPEGSFVTSTHVRDVKIAIATDIAKRTRASKACATLTAGLFGPKTPSAPSTATVAKANQPTRRPHARSCPNDNHIARPRKNAPAKAPDAK